MGVSRRSYAAQRGVSEAAVRKANATGQITTLSFGRALALRSRSKRSRGQPPCPGAMDTFGPTGL